MTNMFKARLSWMAYQYRKRLMLVPTESGLNSASIVVAYRGIPSAEDWATGDSLVSALRSLGHTVYPYGTYGTTTLNMHRQLPESCDILIYCECNDDEPQYWELSRYPAKHKVYWTFDSDFGDNAQRDQQLNAVFGFEAIFYANKNSQELFTNMNQNSFFLPYAIDDRHFYKDDAVKKTTDVALLGAAYPARVQYLKKLEELGAHVDIHNGFRKDQFREAINSLKIQLNLNLYQKGAQGLLVGRVWETLGCGTFLLTEQKDYIEDFFEDGKHLVLFKDEKDCSRKIKYYLEHESERESIAKAGYELGRKKHTYRVRAQEILRILGSITS